MVHFTAEKISDHIIKISTPGVYCYLVTGKENACLIDTGFGIGNLKGFVENLTDLPYFVLVSHCHVDHVSGAASFKDVYLNEKDWFLYEREASLTRRKESLERFRKGFPEIAQVTEEDYDPLRKEPFLRLHDGDVFDLGGVHVEAVEIPGHTPGMTMFLIREERIMFYGDGCTKHTYMFIEGALSIPEYLESLKKLKTFDDRYDTVIRSHNIYTQPKYILDENIELCERIIAGTDAKQPVFVNGQDVLSAAPVNEKQERLDGKTANLYYRRGNISFIMTL